MKKMRILLTALAVILSCTGMAWAGWQSSFSFGVSLPPVTAWVSAPAPGVPYPAYPPYAYRSPVYYGYRVWIPGYWGSRWTPYGWTKVWVPGYWRTSP